MRLLRLFTAWRVRRKAAQLHRELRSYMHNDPLFAPVWMDHIRRTQEMRARIYVRGRREAREELDRVTADNRRVGLHRCYIRPATVGMAVIRYKGALPTVPSNISTKTGVVTGYAQILQQLPAIDVIKVDEPDWQRVETYNCSDSRERFFREHKQA